MLWPTILLRKSRDDGGAIFLGVVYAGGVLVALRKFRWETKVFFSGHGPQRVVDWFMPWVHWGVA